MYIMINSIFFQVLSSWEVIAAIIAFLIVLPITFYIASHDKNVTLEFVGIRKKKKEGEEKKGKRKEIRDKTAEEKEKGEEGKRKSDRAGSMRKRGIEQKPVKKSQTKNTREKDDGKENGDSDKKRYELLKRLKSSKGKK
jgi:predicted membrane protein